MKRCTICDSFKDLVDFKKDKRRSDGYSSHCKACLRIKGIEYYQRTKDERKLSIKGNRERSYNKNKEKENLKSKKYKENNRDRIREYNKIYRLENSEKCKSISKEYRKNNLEKIQDYQREYLNNRLKNDKLFKLSHYTKNMIRKSFKRNGYSKKSKTYEILGCSFEDFKIYLESKFQSWMNWNNYGLYNGELNYGWDIDHIIPLSSASSEEELIKLNHFENLQPLCSKINRDIKKDNL